MDIVDTIINNHINEQWDTTKAKLALYMTTIEQERLQVKHYDDIIENYDDYIIFSNELHELSNLNFNDLPITAHISYVKRIKHLTCLCKGFLEKRRMIVKIVK